MQGFVKKFFDLPVLLLLLLLLYAFASRRTAPSATASVSALPAPSSLTVAGSKSCRVTAPKLNVRSSPNGEVIRILKHNDAVTNNGWEGSWIKTDSGYVHGQYVSC